MKKILLILSLFFIANTVHAEIYQNIRPLDTLGDIKKKFPNAKFTKLNPAWAKPSDLLIEITGSGLAGSIVIRFTDTRPYWEDKVNSSNEESKVAKMVLESLTEDSAHIYWVKFAPNNTIPIERLISKYKTIGILSYSDDNFSPQMEWADKGVLAYLSDDKKSVLVILFSFTEQEEIAEYKAKGLDLPQHLVEIDKKNRTKKKFIPFEK